MTWAIDHCDRASPYPQRGTPTKHRRRVPADSEIDPSRSLAECFDLIRVADPERYPAYFTLHGRKFRIAIEPIA
jgi:methionyl-tRNA formyltransferase